MPDFKIESSLDKPVIGIDEVGRGPLAGPVVSCACMFLSYSLSPYELNLLDDSKKLSPQKRKKSLKIIMQMQKNNKLKFAIGSASVKEIDKFNILQATILSMKRAILKLNLTKGNIIVDGNVKLEVKNFKCKNFIKGDQLSTSIATASIIAKVHRDKYMANIGKQFPHFKWEVNAGYGTKTHLKELHKRGISPYHRKSFKPIKNFIHNNKSSC